MAYLCYSTFVLLDTKYLQKYRVKIRIWICDNLPDCFLWKTNIKYGKHQLWKYS